MLLRAGQGFGLLCLIGFGASFAQAGHSNSLLDVSVDGKFLLAANTDNGTVTVIDTTTRKALREISVGHRPEGVSWIGSGPLAVVTAYRDNQVVLFNAQTGVVVKKLPVAVEPYGVVVDAAGKKAYVTHEYPGLVSEIDLEVQKVVREIPAGSFVRGLALTNDGQRLYVTEFYTGSLHALEVASGKVVDSWQGHSTDNLSRQVILHPHRPKAYLPHIRSIAQAHHGAGSIFPQLSFIDLRPGPGKRRVSFGMDTFNSTYVVTNPWEAAISPDGKRFFIVYAGTNDMNVCEVIDDDYNELERKTLPVRVGQNPRAVRLSPDGQTVYVYNAMDFAVSVYQAGSMRLQETIKTCPPAKTPAWVRGKILFNTALPPMTSRRWIACFSCHPDGHHDARVWQQPEGLRKSPAMFGLAHTHPLHWSADRDEVQDFEFTIRSPLMQGAGLLPEAIKRKKGFQPVELEEKTSGRTEDLDALAVYCNSFEFSLSPHIVAPGKLSPAAARGKEVFFRKEVGCAECHSGPYFTDSSLQKPYKLHDIGTGNDDKSDRMGPKYDTPTLLGLYRSAPYLHHGRAKTLQEVMTIFNKADKHGKTSHLQPSELDDLVVFLKSLPYETPPDLTPNTVPFRVLPKNKNGS